MSDSDRLKEIEKGKNKNSQGSSQVNGPGNSQVSISLDQSVRPIYDHLVKHKEKTSARYHIPGHIGGSLFADAEPFWPEMGAWDGTESYGMDDLHSPEYIIRDAENLLAQAFQGDDYGASYIMINGSSSGLLAAINGLFAPDDEVIIQRNAHKSIYNAAMVRGLAVSYIHPDQGNFDEIAGVVSPAKVQAMLAVRPEAKGLVITSPTFYGRHAEIRKIADICQARGVLLIVDEAHGAHFPFHEKLVGHTAIRQGADVVINSIHKTLPALTMGSALHVSKRALGIIDLENLNFYRSLFQTTSPSYLVMASIDYARHWAVHKGQEALDRAFVRKERLLESLVKYQGQGLVVLDDKLGVDDPLKLTLSVQATGLSGKEWERRLAQYHVYVELVGAGHLLLILGMQNSEDNRVDDQLLRAIDEILVSCPASESCQQTISVWNQELYQSEQVIPLSQVRQVMHREEIEHVDLADCLGRVVADFIIPYPPGIPLLAPGERMTADQLAYIQEGKALGLHFHGPADKSLATIRCFLK